MDNKLAEYQTFRNELMQIVMARYTILGALIAGIGVLTGIAVNCLVKDEDIGAICVVPLGYLAILIPAGLIIYYLTDHYKVIDAYIWARTESSDNDVYVFQRAYDKFIHKRRNTHRSYSEPLCWTYIALAVLCYAISFVLLTKVNPHSGVSFWIILSSTVIIGLVALFWIFKMSKIMGRKHTKNLKDNWVAALKEITDQNRTGDKK